MSSPPARRSSSRASRAPTGRRLPRPASRRAPPSADGVRVERPAVDVEQTTMSGGDGDRTHYLLHAMQALYQLSYAPIGPLTLPVDRRAPSPRRSSDTSKRGYYSPARDGTR